MKLKFVQLAKKIAQKSSSEFQLSCIITNKNRVVSIGWNEMSKSHPKSKTHSNHIHAEFHALMNLPFEETRGTTAYVYRIKKNGSSGMAKSCPACRQALSIAGIKRVYYSTDNSIEEEKL